MTIERISKIVELKEFTKEQLEIEVKKSRVELDEENAKLNAMKKAFGRTLEDFKTKQCAGSVHSGELEIFYTYVSHLNKRIQEQQETVVKKLSEVEIKQKAMLEAYKEQRLFEILHDKMLTQEKKDTSLKEQKEMDFDFISRKMRK